jgi:hypothetical protein
MWLLSSDNLKIAVSSQPVFEMGIFTPPQKDSA